ncbi:MAG: TonB-dependent receptor [Flammeovirgaceae bacterium]|nr:MAG: TonB-dependent receptor [Flammeovirgaceae bacterium]
MKKEIKVWAMTMIACWFWVPTQTNAQQDSLSSTTLREVVVTATKFPKNVSETGKILTIIDEEQLSRSAGKDLSQLLNEQVGLVINGANSNPAKDKSVFLRGAAGKYTLILVDGIPVNDPSGIDGAFDLRLLSIDQVERIEILKGSQSTLYGTDAIAGVINIITKKKGDKPVSGSGTVSYGSYNTFRGNAGVSGSTKKFDYNLGYTRFQTDGLSEARDTTGTAGFDKDGAEQHAVQVYVGYKPVEKLSLRPFLRFNDFKGDYDLGAFTDDAGAKYDATTLQYGLNTDYRLTNGSVSLMYAHNKYERTFSDMFGSNDYDGRFDHGEIFAQFNLSAHVQVLGGLSYQQFKMIATNTTIENPETTITSPYVSFFINNLKGFSAEVGGRLNSHSVYGNNFTYSVNPSYLINKKAKLFINYSTGFKAPTLSQLYGPFGANEDLKPEESKSFEGGLQWLAEDGKVDVRLTYFNRKIDNVIAYTTGYINWDKLADRGVEVEAFYKLNKFTFTGFYAYVEGEVTTPVGAGTETKPNDLLRRPKHSVGLNVGFQATEKLFASLNFKTFGQRNDLFFDFNTFAASPVVLDAYQLLDVYMEYVVINNRIKLFGDFRNLLNQDYYEVYGYSTQRFNATVGVRAQF